MTNKATAAPHWATSSFGDATHTSPLELSALGDHLALCRQLEGSLSGVRCSAGAVHTFVTSRFVSTLAVVTLLIGIVSVLT